MATAASTTWVFFLGWGQDPEMEPDWQFTFPTHWSEFHFMGYWSRKQQLNPAVRRAGPSELPLRLASFVPFHFFPTCSASQTLVFLDSETAEGQKRPLGGFPVAQKPHVEEPAERGAKAPGTSHIYPGGF